MKLLVASWCQVTDAYSRKSEIVCVVHVGLSSTCFFVYVKCIILNPLVQYIWMHNVYV